MPSLENIAVNPHRTVSFSLIADNTDAGYAYDDYTYKWT